MKIGRLTRSLARPFVKECEQWLRRLIGEELGESTSVLENRIDLLSLRISPPLRDPAHRWHLLQIGITDLCNLLCAHCTRTPGARLNGTVPLKTFRFYLSRFSPDWFDCLLISDWGEPTIVKSLLDYLYFAKLSGWNQVQMFTNATNPNEHLLEEIIAQQLLSLLFVSVEGATPELYESIRKNPFERFQSFLKLVSRLKEKFNSPMEMAFNVVCMRKNLAELPAIIEMAARFGASRVQMVHINPIGYLRGEENDKLCIPEQHLDSMDRKQVLYTFERVFTIAERHNIVVHAPESFPEITGPQPQMISSTDLKCSFPLQWVHVGFHGDIFPCCQMGERLPMGNIHKLDFFSIWNNLKYKTLIDGLRPGGSPADVCADCNILAGKSF